MSSLNLLLKNLRESAGLDSPLLTQINACISAAEANQPKKRKVEFPVPTKFKHLRFVDEDGAIMNHGGYSLAYRCLRSTQDPSIIEVHYAYSECNLKDNFDHSFKRRAYHRLNGRAPEFYESFDVHESNFKPEQLIADAKGFLDFKFSDFDIELALIRHFLTEWASYLYLGDESGPGSLIENLITHNGKPAISSAVLDYDNGEDEDDGSDNDDLIETAEAVLDVSCDQARILSQRLANTENPIQLEEALALLEQAQKDFDGIARNLVEVGVSLGDDEEDESDDDESEDDEESDED